MRPYFPIIYVRGYAMTSSEIAATVATPYMGFNLGSTKMRQTWDKKPVRYIFESPLVRLMKEYKYSDIYLDGTEQQGKLPERSVVIYRYYEQVDQASGTNKAPTIVHAAKGLKELIGRLQKQVCGSDKKALAEFRVYLVAHSMGGLICRCFLQNDDISNDRDRAMVDKVFTYATPHNGIDLLGMNVPEFLQLWDMNNFSRPKMAEYLKLPRKSERVDSLNGKFDPERFFCLVGTDYRDYGAAGGLSAKAAGEMSDGLVQITNATVQGAPRAFVQRSHSGPYGIVNSEEGYQNLTRFLFGDVKVEGSLEVGNLPLPPTVQKAYSKGAKVRASYYFEATVSPRGALTYVLTERRKETFSAVLRTFDEMFKPGNAGVKAPRWPVLFSGFLNRRLILSGKSVVFSVELAVSSTDYTINKVLRLDQHIPGEYLFRNTLSISAMPKDGGWVVRYALADESWAEQQSEEVRPDTDGTFRIPLSSEKGFQATLCLAVQPWNQEPEARSVEPD